MLNDYFSMVEDKNHGKVIKVVFRDKKKGWAREEGTIHLQKGNAIEQIPFDTFFSSYYGLFLRGEIYRNSCYHCEYACPDRVGDITIGDFWGIEETNPLIVEQLNKNYGISLCIVNSDKGREMMQQASMLEKFPVRLSDALLHNGNLNKPSQYSELRDVILRAYVENGWEKVDSLYLKHVGLKPYVNNWWYRSAKKVKDSLFCHKKDGCE